MFRNVFESARPCSLTRYFRIAAPPGNGRLDTNGLHPFNSLRSGVPVALIGQEGIRCVAPFRRQDNSGAAPATVGGELFSQMPLGLAVQGLGRRRRVRTREPGDLPERSHPSGVRGARSGRTSAVVTESIVTRTEAAMAGLGRILSNNLFTRARIATGAAMVIASATGAFADDIMTTKAPTIPFAGSAYNWNGFYAGRQSLPDDQHL
jgi:hypothetical protein